MSCTLGPTPVPPVLPGPFTLTPPPLPPLPGPSTLCCKTVGFDPVGPLPPLPPGVSQVFNTIITAMMDAIQPYLDALPIKCPKE